MRPAAILTDIEGTTTSIAFVHEVLFPYARRFMPTFVRAHATEPAIAVLLDEARTAAGLQHADLDALIGVLDDWMARDQKVTPLKALQGLLWRAGYERGDFTGHVYDDAAEWLRAWSSQGHCLYVYSSGSVPAQKLLYGFSDAGDLTPLFQGYFDTRTGHKRETASYRSIAAAIGRDPAEVVFLSDVVEELDAAKGAGMRTVWLVRDGDIPSGAAHRVARTFHDVSKMLLSDASVPGGAERCD